MSTKWLTLDSRSFVLRNDIFIKLVFLLGGGLALLMALAPVEHTVGRFLYDDMFYYLRIAEFLAAGGGSTFDGIEATNGYHPLWMLICTVLAFLFSGDMLVHALLMVSASLHVAQGYVLWKIIERYVSLPVQTVVLLFWLVNWRTLSVNLCGLETGLAALMLLCVMKVLLEGPSDNAHKWSLKVGAMLGLAVMARFDLLLLVAFGCGWLVFERRYTAVLSPVQRGLQGIKAGAMAFLVMVPWFVFSWTVSNSLLPNSRLAVDLLTSSDADTSTMAGMATYIHEQFWSFVWWTTDVTNFMGVFPLVAPEGKLLLLSPILLLSVIGLVTLGVVYFRRQRKIWLMVPVLLYFFMHAGYYVVFHRTEFRYVLPPLLVFMMPLAVAAQACIDRWKNVKKVAPALLVLMFIVTSATGWSAYQKGMASVRVHHHHYVALEMANWLAREHPDAVIGAWNAGVLSYFSQTELVNLDGVVNDSALEANAKGELGVYILQRGIDFLVDEPGQMDDNLKRFARSGAFEERLGPVIHQFQDDAGRVIVMRQVLRGK